MYLPQIDPVMVQSRGDLPIDPYLVGLLLGDGGLTHDFPRFTTVDDELVESVRRLIPEGATVRQYGIDYSIVNSPLPGGRKNSLMSKIRALGMDRLSIEKSIPEVYLWASVADRIALLQGLMDTDGSADKLGRAEYSTSSSHLAKQVQYLIQSLGGKVAIIQRWTKGGRIARNRVITSSRLSYRLTNIRFPIGTDFNLFRLKRKASRYADGLRKRKHVKGGWCVKSIELCGEQETVCISVSAPSCLYFTEHFVPTHNTGGYSRSRVSMAAFFLAAEQSLNHILETFDDQILRPLVRLVFGRAEYVIKPTPLRPPEQGEGQGRESGGGGGKAPGGETEQQPKPSPDQRIPWSGGGAKPGGDGQPAAAPAGAAQMSLGGGDPAAIGWRDIVTRDATHVRIVGPTASGKSTVAQAIASAVEGKIITLDPVWTPGSWGGLPVITVSPDGEYGPIKQAIIGLLDEMKHRVAGLQRGDPEPERLTVIADEIPNTIMEVPEMGQFIRRLAQWGRHANMHLIGIAQSSRVGSWGLEGFGDVSDNFVTIYLGSKAQEVMPGLRGEEHLAVLEWRGHEYPIDLSPVLELSHHRIDPSRAFHLPGVGAAAAPAAPSQFSLGSEVPDLAAHIVSVVAERLLIEHQACREEIVKHLSATQFEEGEDNDD